MNMGAICGSCNQREFHRDHQTGELVCQFCGAVAEESRIVSEVSFSENTSGKTVVTGQYVSRDHSGVVGAGLYGLQQGESRQQTIEKARHRMEKVGQRLGIAEHIIEAGLRLFRTALANNFVKGRKSHHVVSACLYLACRLGKSDIMLMDFAELIHINVFHIGATYLQLVRNQKIKELPIVDPTVYIPRFTSKLQFGREGTKRVVNDAKLLVQRMGKDWLQQGRRPAGVAAACILLAARMNNFRRSKAEIVHVAKIAEETLQRRLDEFKNTSAGTLTVQDFRGTNVESAADPPSFTRHRELEKKMAERLARDEESRAQGGDPEDAYLDPDMVAMAKELDKEDGKTLAFLTEVDAVLQIPELQHAAEELSNESRDHEEKNDANILSLDDTQSVEAAETAAEDAAEKIALAQALGVSPESAPSAETPLGRAERFLRDFKRRRAERLEQERQQLAQPLQTSSQTLTAEEEGSLSDVDDDEIESMLLTEEEIDLKTKVWMSINREYLLEQERKRLRLELDQAAGVNRPTRKKRRTRTRTEPGQASTAEANAANMMKERAPSKKINYAVVKELFAK